MTAIVSICMFINSKQFLSRLKIHSSCHHLIHYLGLKWVITICTLFILYCLMLCSFLKSIYLQIYTLHCCLIFFLDCPVVFLIFKGIVAVNHLLLYSLKMWDLKIAECKIYISWHISQWYSLNCYDFSQPFLTCLRCLSAPGPSRWLDRTHQLFWEEVLL